MEIKRVIIHELVKKVQSNKVILNPSTETCEVDENTEILVYKLDERYQDLNITYARFKTSNDANSDEGEGQNDNKSNGVKKKNVNKFKLAMDNYFKEETDQSFTDFTTEVMKDLKDIIKEVRLAKGGYFVFADYESSDHERYLGIFLIRHIEGMFFIRQERAFSINPAIGGDFEKMALACRINKEKYERKEKRYLSFVSSRNEEISRYFIYWFSAEDLKNNKIDTANFLNILEDIELPEGMDRDKLKQDVYYEIQEDFEGMTNLRTLAKKFYGNEKVFVDYADRKGIEIDSEFKVDQRKLIKSMVIRASAEKIEGQLPEIEIIFPAVQFGSKVRLDDENPNLIIIDSKELADKIRELMGLN